MLAWFQMDVSDLRNLLGLCQENLKPSSDGPQTLCGDLQGFWDMMMLQVDNIDASYVEIQKIRDSGWKVSTGWVQDESDFKLKFILETGAAEPATAEGQPPHETPSHAISVIESQVGEDGEHGSSSEARRDAQETPRDEEEAESGDAEWNGRERRHRWRFCADERPEQQGKRRRRDYPLNLSSFTHFPADVPLIISSSAKFPT